MSKKLSDILQGLEIKRLKGNTDIPITGIQIDSRKVEPGNLFVALKGTQTDGHKYIPQAIEKGASAVVCQDCPDDLNAVLIQVPDTQVALARLAVNFYDNPSAKLQLVGVTGTNGKTTIATSLYRLWEMAGQKAGLISTIRYLIHQTEIPATHTTPNAITLNELLHKMVNQGCRYAFMEVSSHAIDQHRTDFLDFDGAIFTNITHDHLDYHGSFRNYLYTKKKLFDSLKPEAFALVNADDKNARVMVQNTKARIFTYGIRNFADFSAKILEKDFASTLVLIDGKEVWLRLVGQFNISNLLAVYATAVLMGMDRLEALTLLSKLEPVEGRFEVIAHDDITAIIDYAHTPDALEKILNEIRSLRSAGQRIITVFGAGGNRDKDKRPKMGRIAADLSDVVIVTSDNPRNEDPLQIIEQIVQGVAPEQRHKILKNPDRREAIRTAITIANKGDIILIAGKGHETYQEIQGKKYFFDDRQVVRQFLGIDDQRINQILT